MKKTAPLSVRITPDLKAALEALAEADKRSLASYVEIVLQEHVERANASAAVVKHTPAVWEVLEELEKRGGITDDELAQRGWRREDFEKWTRSIADRFAAHGTKSSTKNKRSR
ncbi:MAG: hypothetical protein AB7L90_10265 [Hyphomicrobiaceae bacterium]